nr:hypothetical protein [Tanacetum cinerariifolium]
MTLTDEERVSVGQDSANNDEWVKNSIQKKILGISHLTEDTSSFRPKDPVFVKSSVDNLVVLVTGSNKSKLSEAEDSTLSNHHTGKVPSNESQRNTTDHSVVVYDFLAIDYDLADESLVDSTPFLHWRS